MTSTRRGLIGAALAAAADTCPAAAAHAGGAAGHAPEAATLLAPGPEDGAHAALAHRLAAGLSRALVRATALRVAVLGGPDGVTAANRFAASTPGEERALLLLPGLAGQAALVGDNRVRFEARHWPAVCAGMVPAVLAGRPAATGAGPARVAVTGPAVPEMAGLLALDLLGRPAVPVAVPAGATAEAMVATGAADVAVLAGPALPARLASLGLQPLLTFDTPGQPRDPALPDTPGLGELLPDPAPLVAAARAAGAALRLRGVLVLPALSSADTVALWRGAARRWVEEEPDAAGAGTRRLVDRAAAAALATLVPSPEVTLAYREWLLRRFNWRAA